MSPFLSGRLLMSLQPMRRKRRDIVKGPKRWPKGKSFFGMFNSNSLTKRVLNTWCLSDNYKIRCIRLSKGGGREGGAKKSGNLVPGFPFSATFEAIWSYLQPFTTIWSHFQSFGAIWRHLEAFGALWTHLEEFGGIWSYLELFGGILSYFDIYEAIWSFILLFLLFLLFLLILLIPLFLLFTLFILFMLVLPFLILLLFLNFLSGLLKDLKKISHLGIRHIYSPHSFRLPPRPHIGPPYRG